MVFNRSGRFGFPFPDAGKVKPVCAGMISSDSMCACRAQDFDCLGRELVLRRPPERRIGLLYLSARRTQHLAKLVDWIEANVSVPLLVLEIGELVLYLAGRTPAGGGVKACGAQRLPRAVLLITDSYAVMVGIWQGVSSRSSTC
jgi:hypothetical protein